MKILPDDPRLTAYALGEIDTEAERAQIEAAVNADPKLQAVVEATRELATELSEGLAAEPTLELSEFEKARLEPSPLPRSGLVLFWAEHRRSVLGAAAALALLGVVIPQFKTYQAGMVETDLAERDTVLAGREHLLAIADERTQIDADWSESPALGASSSEDLSLWMPPPPPAQAPVITSAPGRPVPMELFDRANADSRSDAVYRTRTFANVDSFASPVSRPTVKGLPSKQATVWNTEGYDLIEETGFRSPLVAPLSTFSIDVDTASYANVRRFLNQGQLPPADAVRIEELINYFPYEDAPPAVSLKEGGHPFAVHMAQTVAPWQPAHRLVRIALKGYEMPWAERPASNLVFLIDVSGSMNNAAKLPLLKEAMSLLVRRLDARDRVAIVVYAGASGLVLPSTTANNQETIQHSLDNLQAGGSTNAGAGIELAYKVAREHFIEGGNNRIILCTDGDFNIGQTNRGELGAIAEAQAAAGVSLTVLGFGMGNYKDDMLEILSNKGKGSYAYIDSEAEARKVFIRDLASNLFKIAKDVKIQVEFNPSVVQAYRLIGYENRRLQAEDFNDDKKVAGDIGPGHSVVALYEIVPVGADLRISGVDPLKYQIQSAIRTDVGEMATVKLRYKRPEAEASQLIEQTLPAEAVISFDAAADDLRFGAAVAGFGMLLRQSGELGDFGYREVSQIALGAMGQDPGGHRSEFAGLVRIAERLANPSGTAGRSASEMPSDLDLD